MSFATWIAFGIFGFGVVVGAVVGVSLYRVIRGC